VLDWLDDLPLGFGFLVAALCAVGVGLGGMLLLRPYFHRWIHGEERTNEMVSLSMASFFVFYGILVGLVAVGVYANYASAQDNVTKEASSLAALYNDVGALPVPQRSTLLADLRAYAKETIEEDWPAQWRGVVPGGGTARLKAFQRDLVGTTTTRKSEEIAYAEAFGQLEKLVELRSNRLAEVGSGIPTILWWVLWIGAFLSILIVWMLDMDVRVHGILTAVLSAFIGIVIFLIADMDQPFRGRVIVTPDPYVMVYRSFMNGQ
jgi:hypothetical protein